MQHHFITHCWLRCVENVNAVDTFATVGKAGRLRLGGIVFGSPTGPIKARWPKPRRPAPQDCRRQGPDDRRSAALG